MPGILWKLKLRYFYSWAVLFFGSNVIPYSSQKEQSQANIVSDNNYKKNPFTKFEFLLYKEQLQFGECIVIQELYKLLKNK